MRVSYGLSVIFRVDYLGGNSMMSGVGEGGYVVWGSVDWPRRLERVGFVYDTKYYGRL